MNYGFFTAPSPFTATATNGFFTSSSNLLLQPTGFFANSSSLLLQPKRLLHSSSSNSVTAANALFEEYVSSTVVPLNLTKIRFLCSSDLYPSSIWISFELELVHSLQGKAFDILMSFSPVSLSMNDCCIELFRSDCISLVLVDYFYFASDLNLLL